MDLFVLIAMAGGLAMFLYGMHLLGAGLEKLSGGRLAHTLEKLTSSTLSAVLMGALVTAAVQSSSATTVVVVGLVNARVLKLRQAIGVIMGANIGTTVTAHILRLAGVESSNLLLRFLTPSTLAPLFTIIGVVLLLAAKRTVHKEIGQILIGFGILFTGMLTMSDSVAPLADMPAFSALFTAFQNPLLGVLVGAAVTAIIQSSSASVGILQALSGTGAITWAAAFPIIMGQNIGTTITPILASIGASKNAKRSALVHLTFNLLGTLLFLAGTYTVQYTIGFPFWGDPITMSGIANFHTIFNVMITLVFLPLTGLLEHLVCRLVPETEPGTAASPEDAALAGLDDRLLVSPGLAVDYAHRATVHMGRLALENFTRSMAQFDRFDPKVEERLRETEDVIDRLESRLGAYLLKFSGHEMTKTESQRINELLQVISEFERVGDYSMNNAQCAMQMEEENAHLSSDALEELHVMGQACTEIIELAIRAFEAEDPLAAQRIEPLEEVVDAIRETLGERHVLRLREGHCSVSTGILFVETLGALERVADHCSNVGVHVITHRGGNTALDRHGYLKEVHRGASQAYTGLYQQYGQKYYSRIEGDAK